jgi:hypothetical protein
VSIAKGRDDLWVGVKCQANLEIAGSPRNAFRCSPGILSRHGGSVNGSARGLAAYQPEPNDECRGGAPGVRLWERSSIVERETAQTAG